MNATFLKIAGLAAICGGLFVQTAAADALAWEQKMLANPPQQLLKAEARGRVTIYDGVYEQDIDNAMTNQFDRIQNMMFVHTRHNTATGHNTPKGHKMPTGDEYQDDDC